MTGFNWLSLLAQAQGRGGGSAIPGGCGGGMAQLVPIILMFAVFYVLLIRPQQKRAREHREMLANLKKGDDIITNGGLVGRISGITDRFITLEVAEKIRLQVLRTHILGKKTEVKDNEPPTAAT